jgi:hypothetical protein
MADIRKGRDDVIGRKVKKKLSKKIEQQSL